MASASDPQSDRPMHGQAEDSLDLEEEDEDVVTGVRRKGQVNDAYDAASLQSEEKLDDDLFGDDADEEHTEERPEQRLLDDENLDSGDDLERLDRQNDMEMESSAEQQEISFVSSELSRQKLPLPSDGELYTFKVPDFLALPAEPFDESTFEPPMSEDEAKANRAAAFNAYHQAMSTVRWRKSPTVPEKMQSNARILRWSDGSLTLQFATQPKKQYVLESNGLAPPQKNPGKPTPSTARPGQKRPTQAALDSFIYLAAPTSGAQILRVSHKVTIGLRANPTEDAASAAKLKLQQSIEAAKRGVGEETSEVVQIQVTEDPELAKRKAETTEKEREKARRRREQQEQKQRERADRTLNRRTGVASGALEDDDELGSGYVGGATARAQNKRPKARKPNRRGEIYSDDEEEYGSRHVNDHYEEDDFVAGSDEEEEVAMESDDDPDEGINLSGDRGRSLPSPKRRHTSDADQDAEGDSDNEAGAVAAEGSPQGRTKRRRVIDDDEEE